ncbi:hypothetical protein REPUB_Repub03eG0069800 [Reevesia pubescens]
MKSTQIMITLIEKRDDSVESLIMVKIENVQTIVGWARLDILHQVSLHHVVAVVDAYPKFVNLKGQIYEGPKMIRKNIPKHAVAIIGYGTGGDGPNAKNYWLVMSSWVEVGEKRDLGCVWLVALDSKAFDLSRKSR